MQINSNWKVESDDMNVILYKKFINKKKGEDDWKAVGYYSTVANALRALVEMGIKGTGMVDLQTIVNKIEEVHKDILKLQGL